MYLGNKMKKISAILLTALLLFNWVGYRLLAYYLREQSCIQLESQLDNNDYDPSRLISIKIPASHLAYYSNSVQYERTDGKIAIGSIQYKFVKRRLFNDTLELICIPDQKSMKLERDVDEFFKLVNDWQHPGHGKKPDTHPGSFKSYPTEYYTINDLFKLPAPGSIFSKGSSCYHSCLPMTFLPTAEHPPQRLS